MKTLQNFLVFIIATILFLPLTAINIIFVVLVNGRNIFKVIGGYFYSSAFNIDRFANSEFRTLWNSILLSREAKSEKYYYEFGDICETISYVLGKNKQMNTLSKTGILLCKILNFFDKDHVEKAIRHENFEKN